MSAAVELLFSATLAGYALINYRSDDDVIDIFTDVSDPVGDSRSVSRNANRLAIDGGTPVRVGLSPPWPFFADDEIAAAVSVLKSGKVNQWTGSQVWDFEKEFADRFPGHTAVAVANGSIALEAALKALGIGPGDEVIVPARSFLASASSVSLVGAKPVFADVDFDTQVITPATIEPLIGPATRAILPVHLSGRPCDMPAIMQLAQSHGLLVIEDCAQSLGAYIAGRPTGVFGHAAAFSFCQDKIITSGGEGGMVLTANEDVSRKVWSWKDHGKSFEIAFGPPQAAGYRWMYESFGTNGRMTEMQAAIGRCQLRKLDRWVAARIANAERLASALSRHACARLVPVPADQIHSYYRLDITIDASSLRPGWSRDRIIAALQAEGIPASVGTCPEIYREAVYARSAQYERLPNAERLGRETVLLLVHPTMTTQYIEECERAIEKVFGAADAKDRAIGSRANRA